MGGDNRKRKSMADVYASNEFKVKYPPNPNRSHSDPPQNAQSTELRSHHDPKKVLSLLAALVRLFTYDNHEAAGGSRGEEDRCSDSEEAGGLDPKTVLTRVGDLLGISAHGSSTPRVTGSSEPLLALQKDGKEEEEDGNVQISKRQKIRPRL